MKKLAFEVIKITDFLGPVPALSLEEIIDGYEQLLEEVSDLSPKVLKDLDLKENEKWVIENAPPANQMHIESIRLVGVTADAPRYEPYWEFRIIAYFIDEGDIL